MQLNSTTLNSIFRHLLVMAVVLCGCQLTGCRDSKPSPQVAAKGQKKPSNQVVTVSYPLQYLTQRIVGESIEVIFPIPDDTIDPQHWRPSRAAIGQMQAADLIIANGTGATYANWLTTVSLPDSKIRNTASQGLSLSDYIAVEDVAVVHSHGPEGEHSHPTMVARTWLDPAIAKKQATYIAAELSGVYPDRADEFAGNLKSLADDLDQLSNQIKSIKRNHVNDVVTATPKLKFFTRCVGAGDRHLTWFEAPVADQANADLIKIFPADGSQPKLILFDDQLPGDELLAVLAVNGLRPIAIDLIDRKSASGDFLTRLQANIQTLASALEQ